MNELKIEREMAESGFTGKELAMLRRHLEKDMTTHISLLSELSKRFIVSCVIIAILVIGWILTYAYGSERSFVSYSFMFVIVAAIIYVFTPMKLGCKSFFFLRKILID